MTNQPTTLTGDALKLRMSLDAFERLGKLWPDSPIARVERSLSAAVEVAKLLQNPLLGYALSQLIAADLEALLLDPTRVRWTLLRARVLHAKHNLPLD